MRNRNKSDPKPDSFPELLFIHYARLPCSLPLRGPA